ncbi:hypothetical protein ACHAWX_005792 [Stephanocyclus meneghinianus]
MTVKPAEDASTPEPNRSTLQPSAQLFQYLSTPITATKEHTDTSFSSNHDELPMRPTVTCTSLVADYGVPQAEIELQTTSVQDPVDQSRILANNAAAWMNMPTCIIFGGGSEV